jgi:membrane-associated phospholipid phosphatase
VVHGARERPCCILLALLTSLTRRLFAVDLLVLLYAAALGLLAVGFASRLPGWTAVAGACLAILVGLPLLGLLRARHPVFPIAFLHDWAFAPIAYIFYLLTQAVVRPIRGAWIADPILIAIDRRVLGTDVAVLLAPLARPWLTELLQGAYTSFYALMLVAGIELYVKRDFRRFHLYSFSCALGFLVSFVGYLLVPAVGPRFTLFDVATVERQLPGLWLTPALRSFVDGGGLVPPGLSKSAAAALAPRDVFPSGHSMMTAMAMYWAWRFRLRSRWGVCVVGSLLIFATMYLRYHYAVDVAAGLVLAAACVAATRPVHAWITRRVATKDRV